MKSQTEQMIGSKVIITCDNWFFAPDGKQYRAAHGTLLGVFTDKDALGIKTNAKSTNWYAQVGRVLMAGCQIHYAVNADDLDVNTTSEVIDEVVDEKLITVTRMSKIYDADF